MILHPHHMTRNPGVWRALSLQLATGAAQDPSDTYEGSVATQPSVQELRDGIKAGKIKPDWKLLSESVLPRVETDDKEFKAGLLTLFIWNQNNDTVQPTMERLEANLVKGQGPISENLFAVAKENYQWTPAAKTLQRVAAQLTDPEVSKRDLRFRLQLLSENPGGKEATQALPVGELIDALVARTEEAPFGPSPFLRLDMHRQDEMTEMLVKLLEDHPKTRPHLYKRAQEAVARIEKAEDLDYKGRLYLNLVDRLKGEGECPLLPLLGKFTRAHQHRDGVLHDESVVRRLFDGVRSRQLRLGVDELKLQPDPQKADELLELHRYSLNSSTDPDYWNKRILEALGPVDSSEFESRFEELKNEYTRAGGLKEMSEAGWARLRFVEHGAESDRDLNLRLRRLIANELLSTDETNYHVVRRFQKREIDGIVQTIAYAPMKIEERIAAVEKAGDWIGKLPNYQSKEKTDEACRAFVDGTRKHQPGPMATLLGQFQDPQNAFKVAKVLSGSSSENQLELFQKYMDQYGGESQLAEVLSAYELHARLESMSPAVEQPEDLVDIEFDGPGVWIGSILLERQD